LKLRIKGNSIRVRLTQGEVEKLAKNESVLETLYMGPGAKEQLSYQIVHDEKGKEVRVLFDTDNIIKIFIPLDQARTWANNTDVGIYHKYKVGNEGVLSISVEKDFTCLKPREGDDDKDTFPHPEAESGHNCC